MSEQGKCAGGYELPGMDKPCKKCGATSREPCPEFARQQADEIAGLRAQLADARALNTKAEECVAEDLGEMLKLRAQLASARKALERLACRHVKCTPLWWQREAREAVSALSDELREGEK